MRRPAAGTARRRRRRPDDRGRRPRLGERLGRAGGVDAGQIPARERQGAVVGPGGQHQRVRRVLPAARSPPSAGPMTHARHRTVLDRPDLGAVSTVHADRRPARREPTEGRPAVVQEASRPRGRSRHVPPVLPAESIGGVEQRDRAPAQCGGAAASPAGPAPMITTERVMTGSHHVAVARPALAGADVAQAVDRRRDSRSRHRSRRTGRAAAAAPRSAARPPAVGQQHAGDGLPGRPVTGCRRP